MFPLYGLSESSFGIIAAGGLNLFSYDDIQKYNETDMNIYRYIVSNIVKKAKKGRKFCVELKSANEGFWANGKYCNHTGFECGMPVRTA